MQTIRRTSYDIRGDFVKNLLFDRGVVTEENLAEFLAPTEASVLNPLLLDNMHEAYEMIKKHMESGNKICLVVDPDVDLIY